MKKRNLNKCCMYIKIISLLFYDFCHNKMSHQEYSFISHLTFMKTQYEQIKNYVLGYPYFPL